MSQLIYYSVILWVSHHYFTLVLATYYSNYTKPPSVPPLSSINLSLLFSHLHALAVLSPCSPSGPCRHISPTYLLSFPLTLEQMAGPCSLCVSLTDRGRSLASIDSQWRAPSSPTSSPLTLWYSPPNLVYSSAVWTGFILSCLTSSSYSANLTFSVFLNQYILCLELFIC